MGSTQWGSFLHNEAKGHMPSLPKTAVSEVGGREQSLIQQQLLLIFLSLYRSLAGRNLYRNASKNILKTWPPLMRKLSGDSCPHQLQTWLLQFDGLRSWCSTETAICSGEQARGLICTNCFQHILLNTKKFNFTSHWRSLSPPVWPGDNVEAAFTTSATALDASTKQTCLQQRLALASPGIAFSGPANVKPWASPCQCYSRLPTIQQGCLIRILQEPHSNFEEFKMLPQRSHSLVITKENVV